MTDRAALWQKFTGTIMQRAKGKIIELQVNWNDKSGGETKPA